MALTNSYTAETAAKLAAMLTSLTADELLGFVPHLLPPRAKHLLLDELKSRLPTKKNTPPQPL